MPRLSNKEIEDEAIKTVIQFEDGQGFAAVDVHNKGKGYDVESKNRETSEIRKIEVKGIGKTLKTQGNWRFVQQTTAQLLLQDETLHIYIVDNLENGSENAGIYVLNRDDVLPRLKIKNPQASYTFQVSEKDRKTFLQERT